MTPKPDDLEPHLRYQLTTRGALIMPELFTSAYGALHLSESTSNRGAYVWLRASAASSLDQPHIDRHEVVLHVSLNDLEAFVEQAKFVLDHHHSVVARETEESGNTPKLKKCNTPACFRLTTQLAEHCCYSCRVAHEGQCDVTHEHTATCNERFTVRGEWKIR